MGAYLFREDGSILAFDVVTQEIHTMKNSITEHPVEKGANVTDHVRAEVDNITLDVFVSNSPIKRIERLHQGDESGDTSTLDLGNGRSASVYTQDNPVDNVSEMFRALRALRDTAELVHVITPLWDYADMVIREVSVPRTSAEGNGAKMTIDLKQVRLVEVRLVPAPIPTEPRGKKAEDKGAKGAKDLATTSGTGAAEGATAGKKSVLATVADKLKGLL